MSWNYFPTIKCRWRGGGVSAKNGYFHLPISQSMQIVVLQFEGLKLIELNPKFLT